MEAREEVIHDMTSVRPWRWKFHWTTYTCGKTQEPLICPHTSFSPRMKIVLPAKEVGSAKGRHFGLYFLKDLCCYSEKTAITCQGFQDPLQSYHSAAFGHGSNVTKCDVW